METFDTETDYVDFIRDVSKGIALDFAVTPEQVEAALMKVDRRLMEITVNGGQAANDATLHVSRYLHAHFGNTGIQAELDALAASGAIVEADGRYYVPEHAPSVTRH